MAVSFGGLTVEVDGEVDPAFVSAVRDMVDHLYKLEHQSLETEKGIEALAEAAGVSVEDYKRATAAMEEAAQQEREVAEKAREAAKETNSFADSWTELKSKIDLAVGAFHTVVGAVDSVVSLAAEQDRLDRVQARLGVSLRDAAAASSEYISQTQLAEAAAKMQAAGISVTQDQLTAFAAVAGDYARNTGEDLNGTIDALTQGLIAGEQEGLRRFGPGLARLAGESHDARERLAELVRTARDIPPAAESAASAWARMRGEVEQNSREAASGFAASFSAVRGELVELQREYARLNGASEATAESAREDAAEWGRYAAGLLNAAEAAGVAVKGIVTLGAIGRRDRAVLSAWGDSVIEWGRGLLGLGTAASSAATATSSVNSEIERGSQLLRERVQWEQRMREVWMVRPEQDWRQGVSGQPGTGSLGERIAEAERNNAKEAGERIRAETWKRSHMGGGDGRRLASTREIEAWNRARMDEWEMLADTFTALSGGTYMAVADFQRLAEGDMERARALLATARETANASADARAELERQTLDNARAKSDAVQAALDAEKERRRGIENLREQEGAGAQGRRLFGYQDEGRGDTELSTAQNRLKMLSSFADTAKGAWDAIGTSISSNLTKIAEGEQGVVEGLQNMVSEALKSLGALAINKGIFYLFEALAAAFFAPSAAAGYLAAGLGLTALGIGLSAAGAAATPTPSAGASAGTSTQAATVNSPGTSRGSDAGSSVTVNHYYSPVIGGREATREDVGDELDFYQPRYRRARA